MAAKKPLISNPGTNAAAIFKTKPFTTNVNKPKVSKLIGRVKNIKTGHRKRSASPMKNAAIKAEKKFET